VEKVRNSSLALDGVNVVSGDQGDPEVVRGWAAESGGRFDVFVDDGGHKSKQILTTFEVMWPHVNRGGLYFIEVRRADARPIINSHHFGQDTAGIGSFS